jgi:Tfp pilus tip-associated adhesin PilY1
MYLHMLHKLVQSTVVEPTEGLHANSHGSWTDQYQPTFISGLPFHPSQAQTNTFKLNLVSKGLTILLLSVSRNSSQSHTIPSTPGILKVARFEVLSTMLLKSQVLCVKYAAMLLDEYFLVF